MPPNVASTSIYDKYAVKYSTNQLVLYLRRSRYSGQLAGSTFWILFLSITVVFDYLPFKSHLLKSLTYVIVDTIDVGTISNLRWGKLGWLLLLPSVLFIGFIFMELLNSRSSIIASIGIAALLCIQISVIVTSLLTRKKYSPVLPGIPNIEKPTEYPKVNTFVRPNIIVVIVFTISWLLIQGIESGLLIHQLKMLSEITYSRETSLKSVKRVAPDETESSQPNI